jgi:serine/threonine protein kinase
LVLKEIKEKYADDAESRSRFLREAEVTGRLEHPGIVPVYGLGYYPDGRPFYAMRFIKRDSLRDTIQRFHAAEETNRDPGERSLAFRELPGPQAMGQLPRPCLLSGVGVCHCLLAPRVGSRCQVSLGEQAVARGWE